MKILSTKWRLAITLIWMTTITFQTMGGVGETTVSLLLDETCADITNSSPSGADQTSSFRFPNDNAPILADVGDAPITTQVASSGTGIEQITYESSDEVVATVDGLSGEVTIIADGSTTITATRGSATAQYTLVIGTILNTEIIRIRDSGHNVGVKYTYASKTLFINEYIGIESQFGTDCDSDGLLNTRVLVRRVYIKGSSGNNQIEDTCIPTDRYYPSIGLIGLQSVTFSPEYITDHGRVVNTQTQTRARATSIQTVNIYQSGKVETVQNNKFDESQRALDYNNNGDFYDLISLEERFIGRYLYSRHIQVLNPTTNEVLEDFGVITTNATRRIKMPDELSDVPNFLRFSGAIDDINIHIAKTSTTGEYYVSIDSNDPSVQLIIRRNEYDPGIIRRSNDIKPDFFKETRLITNTQTISYSIYAIKGDSLYQPALTKYPNNYVRYDAVNTIVPTLLEKALDKAKNIVTKANIPQFLNYYGNVRVEYDPYRSGSSYNTGKVVIGPGHFYHARPLIHEICHGYHINILPNGFKNKEIKALYAMVPNTLNMRYGSEKNNYWRTNFAEFFAETLTTYLYIKSGVVFPNFDPISQVDSTFYNTYMVPYFDKLFDPNTEQQTISFNSLPHKTVGDPSFELTATGGKSGNPVNFVSHNPSVATITDSTVTIVGGGKTTITAKQAGNDSYFEATKVTQTLTVNKGSQTISFNSLPHKTVGNPSFELTATGGKSGNPITFVSDNPSVATITDSTVTIVGGGKTTIIASQPGNYSYVEATQVTQTLTVNKGSQTISFNSLPHKTVGNSPFELTATGGDSGKPITFVSDNSSVATITDSTVTIVGGGKTTITAKQAGNDSYFEATKVTQTLTVNKGSQTISFNSLPHKTVGNPSFELTATGGKSGNPITFVSDNPSVATITDSTVTIVGGGKTTIIASQPGNYSYVEATQVTQTLTVNKGSQTISFNSLPHKTVGNSPFELTATGGDSGKPITFVSDNPRVSTITDSTVTIVGGGKTTITAKQPGNDSYFEATQVTQTLTVNKGSQTIVFNSLPHKTVGDPSFELTATGGDSGKPITFVSDNSSVATITGSTVTIVGSGQTTIIASQPGNYSYVEATQVTQTLTVNKGSQTISFNSLPHKTVGDSPFELTATGGESGNPITFVSDNPSVATITGSTVTIVGSGKTTITVSQPGNDSYFEATQVTQTLTVNKGSQTISFNSLPHKTVGDSPFELTATGGDSGKPITFVSDNPSVATITGSTVTIVGSGKTTITVSQPGNDSYVEATQVTQTLTVNKGSQTISFNSLPHKTVGDSPFELTATGGDSGNPITFVSDNPRVATITSSTVTIVGGGQTTITARQPGNYSYVEATQVTQTLTVNKGSQTIVFNSLPHKTVGDSPFELTATGGDSGNPITFVSDNPRVSTITSSTVTIVGVGKTTITARQPGNDSYLASTQVTQTLTVNKGSQTIVFNSLPHKTVGDPSFELTTTGGDSGNPITFVSDNPSVATITGSTVTIVGSGKTTITVSQPGNDSYFEATQVTQTLTVNKGSQTISFNSLPHKTVGDSPFELTATGGDSGNPITFVSDNPRVATITSSTVTIVGGGQTTITARQPGNYSYLASTQVTQTLTVNKGSQTIVFNSLPHKTVGDSPFELTATGGDSGNPITFVSDNPRVSTITSSTVTIVGVGKTTITARQPGNDSYLASTQVTQTLTVNKGSQTIVFNSLSHKTVGDPSFELTTTGGDSGNPITFVSDNPSVATITGSTVTIVGSGQTTITARQPGNDSYFEATQVTQTLTVNKGSQTISFNSLPHKTVGDSPFELTATGGESGNPITFVSDNPSVATITGSTVTIVGSGQTTIIASQPGNYSYVEATQVTQTLTVNKGSQTIVFNSLSHKTVGDPSFELTTTGGDSGNPITFVSDNPSVATITGSTVTIVGSGQTTITARQPGNYSYLASTQVTQTLTVNKGSQTIVFNSLPHKTVGDSPFELTATGGESGNPITFVSDNPSVATITGSTVTIVGSGQTTIIASQPGNDSYVEATQVTQTLTVNKGSQTISFNSLPHKTVGNPSFELTATGGDSGKPITFVSDNSSVATITSSTVTIVGSGQTTIIASQPGNYSYVEATQVTQTLTVNKGSQTISFNSLPHKTVGDSPFELTATGGESGNPITFVSDNPSVATITGSTVTIVGSGQTTIIASQPGNYSYVEATQVTQTLTVNKGSQTISFNSLPHKTVGDPPFELTATGGESGNPITFVSDNPSVATITGSTVTIVGGGQTTIIARQPGNYSYVEATQVTQTLTVNKGSQTIVFNSLPHKAVGDPSFELTATGGDSGNPINFVSDNSSVATITGSTVTIVGSGKTTITASQPGNYSYVEATQVTQTLTVNKGSQTVDNIHDTSINVYPNPVSGEFTIEISESSIFTATLHDLSGQLLQVKSGNHKVKMNISRQAQGIYLLHINTKSETITKRILKQ